MNLLSINMANNFGDQERRYEELKREVLKDPPDIILGQEITRGVGERALYDLTQRLGEGYQFRFEEVYPGQEDELGMAIVTSRPIRSSKVVELAPGGNKFQIVELGNGHGSIGVANVHLEAAPQKELLRIKKTGELALYMAERFSDAPQAVVGDWSVAPCYPTILMMKLRHGYTSAMAAVHGVEHCTFPMMDYEELLRDKYLKPEEVNLLQKLLWIRKSAQGTLRYALDYAFLKNMPQPLDAHTVDVKSDHAGLRVELPHLHG